MKLILDLIPQLIKGNEDGKVADKIAQDLLEHLLSIVTGKSTKPLAKSAMQMLEQLFSKGVFSLDSIRSSYLQQHVKLLESPELSVWEAIFSDLLEWMRVHFVCPAAGKFIVCLYRAHRHRQAEPGAVELSIETWYRWLLKFLESDLSRLEGLKNYYLPTPVQDRQARGSPILTLHERNQLYSRKTNNRCQCAYNAQTSSAGDWQEMWFCRGTPYVTPYYP